MRVFVNFISYSANQGRSDGGISVYIYPQNQSTLIFYAVVLSPWPIYTHPNQIPGYIPAANINC